MIQNAYIAPSRFLIIIAIAAFAIAQCREPAPEPSQLTGAIQAAEGGEFSYDDYAAALKAYVDDRGMVKYKALKAERNKLDAFAGALAALNKSEYARWSDKTKIAFWVNAYNALTLEAIINNYPIKSSITKSITYPKNSIRQIPGVWDEIRWQVMGEEMTLDEIEHEQIRGAFNEPRVHMALVCAAMGCPPLRNEPFIPDRLDEQLDDQARKFLQNPDKFAIDRNKLVVHLSSIFKWFGDDFIKTYGTDAKFQGHGESERAVLNFISNYVGDDDAKYLQTQNYDIDFVSYDWTLNEKH